MSLQDTSHLFVHLSISGHLGCFHIWAIENSVLWMWVCKHLLECANTSLSVRTPALFSYLTQKGSCQVCFKCSRKCPLFSAVATPLHLPANGAPGLRCPLLPTDTCYFLFVFDGGHPCGYEVEFHRDFGASLKISRAEHLLAGLLAVCVPSSEKCPFKSFANFLNCAILLMNCRRSLHIMDINLLSGMQFANIFSHFVDWLFTLFCFCLLMHVSF